MAGRRLPGLASVSDLIRLYKLSTRKALSQNFILDTNVTDKIARAALAGHNLNATQVVEVGPGPGSLTRSMLAQAPARVTVVEKDDRFRGSLVALAEAVGGAPALDVIIGDMAQVEPARIRTDSAAAPELALVGNLPFNVATPLTVGWLGDMASCSGLFANAPTARASMTLMYQAEVGQRLTAAPGEPGYSRLSVLAAACANAKVLYTFAPTIFVPPPKVSASVVRFVPRPDAVLSPAIVAALQDVTRVGFSLRRKTLRNAIKRAPDAWRAPVIAAVEDAGLASLRAGDVPVAAWLDLARVAAAFTTTAGTVAPTASAAQ
ncbi:ribosomal RNA small subunit methyltransferase A [Thecamonas trahens ATCC 50062]|uniref:rRNA adenine N(6)-methyltransferase n=1 Tax=Thecamonas trahens ATCC 50062 TaxID=461836 RepID=A0A0L0D271_THETB|nr:ribosomal RNA small subunit methyltransferase A [Thecamonas trahens ATCC 50062]KNC46301.1 ribosomal RNA small subunit methyltransferase A [Thecamonas trahens ATCC 50062]|eukprot:XP_013760594.1 ribosomal RNA small subunit methyltransferase A [Thecamonas trahens ATCC 50062]